jgi:hypothetical protein
MAFLKIGKRRKETLRAATTTTKPGLVVAFALVAAAVCLFGHLRSQLAL